MGTPQFGVPILEYLVIDGYQVEAVVTRPDKPAGRGRRERTPPVKEAASRLGLTVFQPVNLRQGETLQRLIAIHPDMIVVAALGLIIPPSVLSLPRYGCLNVHPSLLPRYRGASPIASAILAGDRFTGVSIILLDEGLDTGPVLSRAQTPIRSDDTTPSLSLRLSLIGARFLTDIIPRWVRGEVEPRAQREEEATLCHRITSDMGVLDFNLPASELERRVRAFWPSPGAYTTWQGRRIKIISALALPAAKPGPTGRVLALDPQSSRGACLGITTAQGVLGVLRLQMEGHRPLSAYEFLRGRGEFIGAQLGT